MSISPSTISETIRKYLLEEYFDGPPEELSNDLPLLSSGLIDSISILQMVEFLEQSFHFEFEPHEVDQENLNTIDLIVAFVLSKTA